MIYNIFLTPYGKITETQGVVPLHQLADVQVAIAGTLYAKFVQESVIPLTFVAARRLLVCITDEHVFLQELLRMQQLMLSMRQIASIDIPNFPNTGDIYGFAMVIKHLVGKYGMKERLYSATEVTHLFLDHLDAAQYKQAVETCRNILVNTTGNPPIPYRLPTIATTLSQLIGPTEAINIEPQANVLKSN